MADAFRGMNAEPGTGLPALSVPPGERPLMLDVRVRRPGTVAATRQSFDIDADENGVVTPGHGGLSVNSAWESLPYFTIPRRLLGALPLKNFREAAGGDNARIWSHPAGAFPSAATEPVPFAAGLVLRVERPGKGLVEPDRAVPHDQYRLDIQRTRSGWVVNEPPGRGAKVAR